MKFIYPLGKGSQWQDHELYLSMKSIISHSDITPEIIVIGEAPRFSKNLQDLPNFEMVNMRIKKANSSHIVAAHLLEYIQTNNLREFILMNDDFLALKNFDPKSMPLYFDGTINQRIENAKNIPYINVLKNSIFKDDDLNFAVHYPMPIRDISAFRYALKYTLNCNGGASFRNIYGNMVLNYEIAERIEDVKFYESSLLTTEKLKDKSWLSLSDEILTTANKIFLASLFT